MPGQCHLKTLCLPSTPARAAGMSHRIGLLAVGADADVVLWDSHPLHLGATPRQVWIDGIPQLGHASPVPSPSDPVLVGKPKAGSAYKEIPKVPSWDEERKKAVEYEGLPPLGANQTIKGKLVLKNVREVWIRGEEGIKETWFAKPGQESGTVVLTNGAISCVGSEGWCLDAQKGHSDDDDEIDLRGGAVGPGLMTYGSPLGTEEIAGEVTTTDGPLYAPLDADVPKIMHDTGGLVRAVDALQFGTRNAL